MIEAMWNNFYNVCVRGISPVVRGLIIFVIVICALVAFIYAIKGGKKDKMVKNWFLFFLSMLLAGIGVFYAVI